MWLHKITFIIGFSLCSLINDAVVHSSKLTFKSLLQIIRLFKLVRLWCVWSVYPSALAWFIGCTAHCPVLSSYCPLLTDQFWFKSPHSLASSPASAWPQPTPPVEIKYRSYDLKSCCPLLPIAASKHSAYRSNRSLMNGGSPTWHIVHRATRTSCCHAWVMHWLLIHSSALRWTFLNVRIYIAPCE